MKNKKNIITGITFAVVIALVLAVIGVIAFQNNQEKNAVTSSAKRQTESDELDINTVLYNGQEYKRNTDIETVLFMGIDKKNQEMLEETPVNGGQSDCLILFVTNKKTAKIQMIQISRNAMVTIAMYDSDGEYVRDMKGQICLQYAYGDGKSKSCWLTKNLVSALFYNIPIDGYVALNVEGISIMTTAIGGVDLTVPEDYSAIDPSFTQGAQLNLQGDLAVKYVQYRDINDFGSNNGRMQRQSQFLTALASQLKNNYSGSNWYSSLLTAANPYMLTDLNEETIKQLSSCSLENEILSVPGEEVEGIKHDEFHIDMDGLYQMVLDVFYEPVSTSDEN